MSTELAKTNSAIMSAQQFADLQEQAKFFASSDLVPKEFKDKPANVLIAMEMAARLGAGWFQVIQNLHVIQGRPSFSASFQMAMVAASGRFGPIEYVMDVTGPETTVVIEYDEREGFGSTAKYAKKKLSYTYTPTTCRAVAVNIKTGKEVVGPPASYDLAIHEGWIAKSGSKWQGPMRELMLMYRAGSFFSRLHASDITIGMGTHTREEIEDMSGVIDVQATVNDSPRQAVAESSPAPATDPAHAPAATGTRTRKPRTTAPATEGKTADPAAAPAKAEPQKPAQRGKVVFLEKIFPAQKGENSKGAWTKWQVDYSEADGSTGSACTFSDSVMDPLSNSQAGDRIAIETVAPTRAGYAPTLSWVELLPREDSAPADEKPPFKDTATKAEIEDDIPY